MSDTFQGVFAGKIAFCSDVQNVQNLYLTTNRVSDGHHGWIYIPGMNATTVTAVEKFILYLFPDNYYRIQSGDLYWLGFNEDGGFVNYADDAADAAAFSISGSPFGSQMSVRTSTGDQQLYYLFESGTQIPNVLGTAGGINHYCSFIPTVETVSLDVIRQNKTANGFDFTNVILTGQDLSQGIDFSNAVFSGGNLAGVNFSGAILDNANLSATDLRGLNWGTPKSAVGINISESNAQSCIFGSQTNQINCSKANFSSTDFSGADLSNLNLQGANLAGATLICSVLDKSDLTGANLNAVVALSSSFKNSKLIDATAQTAIFSRAVFDNADLTRIRMGASSFLFDLSSQFVAELDSNSFPQSDLISAFKNNGIVLQPNAAIVIVIKGESWQILDPNGPYKLVLTDKGIQVFNDNPALIPAILNGASLKGVTAPTASLAGADLRNVLWYAAPATLNHADLQDASFANSILVSNDFTQANISGTDFSNCLLTQAKFTGCIGGPGGSQRAISFESAHLEGVDFSKATLSGSLLNDSVIALGSGVSLFFLPSADAHNLTQTNFAALIPVFRQNGFDTGNSPVISSNLTWTLDNSASTDPNAPKQYQIKKGNSGFNVFGNGQFLFALTGAAAPYLNQPNALPQLVSLFAANNYNLAANAPITSNGNWTIVCSSDAAFLRSYRFNTIEIFEEADRLTVYGIAPVLIENLAQYSQGIAFDSTQNILNAFSANAVGCAGLPFSWLAQNLIDEESFFTAP